MACLVCKGIQKWETAYATIWMGKFGKKNVMKFTFDKCPKYVDCDTKGLNITTNIDIDYCPNCGEKLNKEENNEST